MPDFPNSTKKLRKGQQQHSKIRRSLRMAVGFFLAPLDGLYGFGKGFGYFFSNPYQYAYFSKPKEDIGDSIAKKYFFSLGLARIGTVLFSTLCIVGFAGGFVGAVASPLPGTTALYTASVLGILKAIGVTTSWAIGGRAIGAFLGSMIDFFYYRRVIQNENPQLEKNLENDYYRIMDKLIDTSFERAAKVTLFGEGAESWKQEVKEVNSSPVLFDPSGDSLHPKNEVYQNVFEEKEPSTQSGSSLHF